jgi:membrane protein insertase, YidC/Oxa1 family, C-terminal domain
LFTVVLTQYNGVILGPIAKVLGLIFNGLFNVLSSIGIENAGLCIIVFTFIVNGFMIPLTIKQQKFSKLSTKMNPELMKIQEKYKGKKDEASMKNQQLETQALYQKYGANPTSGCLPLLIQMPILFALYRVIYHVPAYVTSIYNMYDKIAVAIQGTGGDYTTKMIKFAENFKTLQTKGWPDMTKSISNDHLIDIMAQFRSTDWANLQKAFPTIQDQIHASSVQIMHVNSFLGGINIADNPSFGHPITILIPILAVATQFLQTKMMMVNTPMDASNPTAQTMKTMNNVMPLVSGFFCMTFPTGIGIYWVAGSVFRIIQQFFVNRYMDHIDVEELIAKNQEKSKNRKVKLGIDPNMQEVAKKRTSSIQEIANSNKTNSKKTSSESSNVDKKNVTYKSGSISSIANMLGNKDGSDKGEN